MVSKQSFQYLGQANHRSWERFGFLLATRELRRAAVLSTREERSVLTLVWLKLRWLDVSEGIQLQIERRQQWKL